MSNIVRSISNDGSVLACCINSIDICNFIKSVHNPSDSVLAALGKLATASSLMGSMMKGEDHSLTIKMVGNGPIGHMISVSDNRGNVKCYAGNYDFENIYDDKGQPNIFKILGSEGRVTVIKDLNLKQPYIGETPIVSGGIAEDIAYYYAKSEQIPTVMGLGLLLENSEIKAAGGYLVQLLPYADLSVIDVIEDNVKSMGCVSNLFLENLSCAEICNKLLKNLSPNVLDETKCEYKCKCDRQKVLTAILRLGKSQIEDILEEDKKIEVRCEFCNSNQIFFKKDILF